METKQKRLTREGKKSGGSLQRKEKGLLRQNHAETTTQEKRCWEAHNGRALKKWEKRQREGGC